MNRKTKPSFDVEKKPEAEEGLLLALHLGQKAVAAASSMTLDPGITRPGTSKNVYEAHWIGNIVIECFPGIMWIVYGIHLQ